MISPLIPLLYALAAAVAFGQSRREKSLWPGRTLATAAFLIDLAVIPRPPGGREIAMVLVGMLVLAEVYLALRLHKKALAPFVLLLAAALRLAAGFAPIASPPPSPREIPPIFLAVHIGLILSGYGAYLVAALAGALFLLAERALRAHHPDGILSSLPPIEESSALQRRAVRLGVVLYTWGIVSGIVGMLFLGEAGRFLRDPTVATSMLLWGFMTLQFLLQTLWGFRRRRAAGASLFGGALIFLIFFALAFAPKFHAAAAAGIPAP